MVPRPEAHRRDAVKTLLTRALALPSCRRTSFLEDACGEDAELHSEVKSLLSTFDDASDYFENLTGGFLPVGGRRGAPNLGSPSDPYDLVGTTVADYHIMDVLGGGGMGVVYRARHEKLDRPAALKFLPPHLGADPEAKERFLHEARAASALDHPGICTIYDVGETPGARLFIAMAYYDGETLKERLIRGPLSQDEALDVGIQIARALSAAHHRGIVHRDVKPANIMLTRDGIVKLLDFGLAKATDSAATKTGATMGTPAYMSPEQVSGKSVGHRTDIWSLGVVLYEALTGRRPFGGDNNAAILHALLHSDPPLPEARLAPVVSKCLAKDPERRYRSMHDVCVELDLLRRPVSHPTVFLAYDGDDAMAAELAEALSHELSGELSLGDVQDDIGWTEQLGTDLARPDILILFITERLSQSEVLAAVVDAANEQSGSRPAVIPVNIGHTEPLSYPLSSYVRDGRPLHHEPGRGTGQTIRDIRKVIEGCRRRFDDAGRRPVRSLRAAGSEPPINAAKPRIEMPEGTMSPFSSFYIVRPEDDVALRAIAQQGVTITIKGPRQMGKSSLLIRTLEAARELGKDVVFLDFQLVDRTTLEDADLFFRQFCAWITDELDLEDRIDAYWTQPLSNGQRCTRYMERHVLKSLARPVVLALDEVERVFDTDFRSDFFSMLRSWHNDRAIKRRWRDLDLALVTSTEPYQLIENLNQSPFNVGEVLELSEFSSDDVAELNRRHGSPLSRDHMKRLADLVGGHPYLVRRALYLITEGRTTPETLLDTAADERGPFGDHLRHHLFRLNRQADLLHGMRQVLMEKQCDDEGIYWRLRGAGLVRRSGRDIVPRSRLYEEFFRTQLNG